MLILCSPGESAENMVANGDIETGANGQPADWKSYVGKSAVFTWASEEAHSGKYSLKVHNPEKDANAAWESEYISVKPDTYYRMSGWMKYVDIIPRKENGLGVCVTYANLASKDGKHRKNVNPASWGKGTSDGWVKQERVFKTLPDTVQLKINPKMVRASGTAWFDDISLEELGENPPKGVAKRPAAKTLISAINKGKFEGMEASASSVHSAKITPDLAFDGDMKTNWVPKKLPCWIQIDLGKEKSIGKIVWSGDRGTGYKNRVPADYRFTVSSTGKFSGEQQAVAGKEGNKRNSKVEHVFKPVKARYVRMEIYNCGPFPEPSIDEIDIFPPPYEK